MPIGKGFRSGSGDVRDLDVLRRDGLVRHTNAANHSYCLSDHLIRDHDISFVDLAPSLHRLDVEEIDHDEMNAFHWGCHFGSASVNWPLRDDLVTLLRSREGPATEHEQIINEG